MPWLAALLLAAIASTSPAQRLDKPTVDALVSPLTRSQLARGVVVGLIDEKGRRVFGYGLIDDGGVVPDGKTVFEIGSVTKTFTATLLAQMVESGEVKLDQPVQELLPAGVKMPIKDGQPIRLLDLSTQHSGLPRMPENFSPADPSNPYVDYAPQLLYEELGTIKLQYKPGEHYEYSNLGVGLLGQVLAVKAGKSYEQLIIERICQPLGMNDTRTTLDDRLKSRLAPGYVGKIKVSNWDFDALAGCGAIRSTADDLLTYLAAELGLVDSPLKSAMQLTQIKRAEVDKRYDIALGWHIGKRTGARWHNGQTSGYHSFVAFVPEKKIGVVVLTNSPIHMEDAVGINLLCAMMGEKVEPPDAPQTRPSTHPTPGG